MCDQEHSRATFVCIDFYAAWSNITVEKQRITKSWRVYRRKNVPPPPNSQITQIAWEGAPLVERYQEPTAC
jgi:hypothetical protein